MKEGAMPAYLLDRENVNRTKILSNMVKQKRKEKAGKWQVPVQKVKAMSEGEMFQTLMSGKRKSFVFEANNRKGMETKDQQSMLRSRELHKETTQIREVYSTNWSEIQEGSCDSSRTEDHFLPQYHWSQTESSIFPLHWTRSHYQRNCS